MSRLIVASNRVVDLEKSVQSGGLATALGDALHEGRSVWFGWDGTIVDEVGAGLRLAQQDNIRTATVPLTRKDHEEYYLGFSSKVLWPAFHYRLDLTVFDPAFLEGYKRVNRDLARVLAALIEPDDLLWVHDYHLIPLADELRTLRVNQRIGFFLHIPFPPPEIFMAVPDHAWLAGCFFAYDLVGFQTVTDTANFIRYATEQAGAELVCEDRLRLGNQSVTVKCVPIGIDPASVFESAHTADAEAHIARLQRRSMANLFVLGVDRLDYTKGLPTRMKAFRRLLELHPEMRKAVTMMQVASPTREGVEAYDDIRQELEGLSGSINGEQGDYDWTPVRYIHRAVPRETLAALFRGSHVGLVTPLRDGMNLVAKEYVAAQDDDDPGVLVLSRFAGAAEDLTDAVQVNPYDIDEVASGLHQALTMPRAERRERHRSLLERVRTNTAKSWRETFISALKAQPARDAAA
ncbi:MAG: trehalose-6-phosphate synthase [Hyphomicrobiales bacterium]